MREVSESNLGELDRARVTWVEETALTRPLDRKRYKSIIAAAEQAGATRDHDLHVDLLWLAASRAWWVDPGPEIRRALIDASHRLGDANAEDPRVFAVHAYADPLGHAAGVLARLKSAAGDRRLDTDAARFFGPAALVVGAFDLGADFLKAAVDGLRTEGRLGHLPRLLMLYSSYGRSHRRLGRCVDYGRRGEAARRRVRGPASGGRSRHGDLDSSPRCVATSSRPS